MTLVARTLALFLLVLALTAGVAALSDWPRARLLPEGAAALTVTFTHSGARVAECRRLTQAEMARLPPNMRRPDACPRGRVALWLELDLDGAPLLRESLPPTGLSGDGPSQIYRRIALPAREHVIAVRLRDSRRSEGFDHTAEHRVALSPGQNLVVDFRASTGFIIR
ncbi:MAG: hypothetical protein IT557_10745 [Alphaproteobacteria bacterium]|nr:hypothetical protein [Alphaproteobacteria bacterium]